VPHHQRHEFSLRHRKRTAAHRTITAPTTLVVPTITRTPGTPRSLHEREVANDVDEAFWEESETSL
jgi:hypothetical protein